MGAGVLYLLIVNVLSFIVVGADKQKARKRQRRISERTLFLWAIIGGSVGSYIGMRCFHHKTKHKRFMIGVPLIIVIQVLALAFIISAIQA
ncbi:DUF1294 domain-containing protein [Alkalihalobacillus oceani]|uniref:DUF1294 domain-containing protein n=1 Tax=Halalkalibacter oceani TaxID=1653776 RepID=A0A9X2DS22_9BACI|nr:DUF1294 domain-containing protein [Halalkalibacter oceani]MCM3716004.1 DUF1294 domain-containing protein [Halalkalibacter oceani]